MRILLLSYDEYPPDPNTGGIGTYTRNLAHGLVDLGHEVHVVIENMPTDFSADIKKGIRIHKCGKDVYRYVGFLSRHSFAGTAHRLQAAFRIARKVKEVVKEKKIDVFEMPECGAQGFFIRKLFGSTVGVVKFHTPLYIVNYYNKDPAAESMDSRCITFLEKLVVKKASLLTSPSQFMADEVTRLYRLEKPVRVVPNGINLKEVDGIPAIDIRNTYGLGSNEKTILYIGSMQPRKVDVFLQAIPAVLEADKNATFIFAGRDVFGFEARLKEVLAARDLPPKVMFVGKQPYQRIIGMLKSVDIFVHPPIFENFPYTCMEAMACRKAIVSTKAGGIPEMVVDGESGILVDPDNGQKLAEAMLAFLGSREMRESFGERARVRVEKLYDHRCIAEQTLKLYEDYS